MLDLVAQRFLCCANTRSRLKCSTWWESFSCVGNNAVVQENIFCVKCFFSRLVQLPCIAARTAWCLLFVLGKYSIEAKMLDLMGSSFCVGQIVEIVDRG